MLPGPATSSQRSCLVCAPHRYSISLVDSLCFCFPAPLLPSTAGTPAVNAAQYHFTQQTNTSHGFDPIEILIKPPICPGMAQATCKYPWRWLIGDHVSRTPDLNLLSIIERPHGADEEQSPLQMHSLGSYNPAKPYRLGDTYRCTIRRKFLKHHLVSSMSTVVGWKRPYRSMK